MRDNVISCKGAWPGRCGPTDRGRGAPPSRCHPARHAGRAGRQHRCHPLRLRDHRLARTTTRGLYVWSALTDAWTPLVITLARWEHLAASHQWSAGGLRVGRVRPCTQRRPDGGLSVDNPPGVFGSSAGETCLGVTCTWSAASGYPRRVDARHPVGISPRRPRPARVGGRECPAGGPRHRARPAGMHRRITARTRRRPRWAPCSTCVARTRRPPGACLRPSPCSASSAATASPWSLARWTCTDRAASWAGPISCLKVGRSSKSMDPNTPTWITPAPIGPGTCGCEPRPGGCARRRYGHQCRRRAGDALEASDP